MVSVCPFGIHSIAIEGSNNDIKPGQWYGPQTISIVLRNINDKFCPIANFKIYVCLDGCIFLDDIEEMAKTSSVLVLVPIRLGIDSI